MSAARRKQRLRVCEGCGCTDTNACIDEQGDPCAWVEGYDGDICTACAAVALAVADADEQDDDGGNTDEGDYWARVEAAREHDAPLVELYSEGDANRAIAELRGAR